MKKRFMVLWLVIGLGFLGSAGNSEELYLNFCDDPGQWRVHLGWEFPGAAGALAALDDAQRGDCLRVNYDFRKGGRYVGAVLDGPFSQGEKLAFWIWTTPGHGGVFMRVEDQTGQSLVRDIPTEENQWVKVEVSLKDDAFSAHWAGANDGKLHFPLRNIAVCLQNGQTPEGYFLLDSVTADIENPPAQLQWNISILPNVPQGAAFVGEAVEYEIRVENKLVQPRRVDMVLEVTTDEGKVTQQKWQKEIPGGGTVVEKVKLSTDEAGYQGLLVRVMADGQEELSQESGLAVVIKPPLYPKCDPDSYFGTCTADLGPESMFRLGCSAVQYPAVWKYFEMNPDDYNWSWIPKACREVKERGGRLLLKLQPRPPDWAAWKVEGKPNLAGYPSPEHMKDWQDFVHDVVEQVKGDIYGIEVDNEPDLSEWLHPGLTLEEGAELYYQLLKAAYEGAKSADPNCVVAGLGVSGSDYHGGLKFCRAVLEKDPKLVDLFPGHPYAFVRYYGPDQKPTGPEENGQAALCQAAFAMLAEFGKPRRMWIGELGWALNVNSPVLSDYSLDFAATVAQSLMIGYVSGVETYLWFSQYGCNEGGHEYGLFRGRPAYALPAACAYSTCARMIDRTKAAGRIELGENVRAWRFDGNRQGQSVVALWTVAGSARLVCQLPSDARIVNSFGRNLPTAKTVEMDLGRMPVYVAVPMSQAEELAGNLAQAELKVKDPLKINHIYLSRRDELHIVIANQINKEVSARIQVGNQEQTMLLKPGTTNIAMVLTKVPAGDLEILVDTEYGRQTKTLSVNLLPIKHMKTIHIDGDLAETGSLKPIALRERKDVLPADPGIPWNDAKDLSIRAWLGYDEQRLYFAAKVTDDTQVVDREDVGMFWQSDSIQMAIDPENDSQDDFNGDDVEIGLVLGKDQPLIYRTAPDLKAIAGEVSIRRAGEETIYEAAIPWSELGIQPPQPDQVMAINFIVNDNDGQGRLYWMGLTPGIAEGKNPGVYRKLVFEQ